MKESELVLGVLLGVGVYLVTRGPRPEQEPGISGVVLGGSVGAIQVGMGQSAVMGSHLLSKTAGEIIKVTVQWNADTRDKNTKLLVPWPYWVRTRLGHSTSNPLATWQDANELGFPVGGTSNNFSMPVTGLQSAYTQFVTPNDNNQAWDIHVELFARQPDSTNPAIPSPDTTKWTLLTPAPVKHDGAIVSWAAGVQLGGSVGAIAVAQRRSRVGRMGL